MCISIDHGKKTFGQTDSGWGAQRRCLNATSFSFISGFVAKEDWAGTRPVHNMAPTDVTRHVGTMYMGPSIYYITPKGWRRGSDQAVSLCFLRIYFNQNFYRISYIGEGNKNGPFWCYIICVQSPCTLVVLQNGASR